MTKAVLITGGARGIGRAIADDLVRDHRVILTYYSDKTPGKIFVAKNPGNLAIRADFTDPDEPAEVVKMAVSAFGKIDAIVNNAAIVAETSIKDMDPAQHAMMYQVNVTAPAALVTTALPHMAEGSAVLNIASVNAFSPPPTQAPMRHQKRLLLP